MLNALSEAHSTFNIQHSTFPVILSPQMSPPPVLPFRHIAVEGPIGVGKTSLTGMLAKRFRGTKILEDADNPFLDDFYKDKRGAAFRTELFFLLSRYDQQRQLAQRDLFTELVIADYTV